MKIAFVVAGCSAAFFCVTPASAQVRDATYRGTLVCKHLQLVKLADRTAIEVNIKGSEAIYTHKLRDGDNEAGSGQVDGQKISLKGSFKGKDQSYEASYEGTFLRRSAKLTGTQVWTIGGKTYTRDCSGSIKRPFAPFLPKDKKV